VAVRKDSKEDGNKPTEPGKSSPRKEVGKAAEPKAEFLKDVTIQDHENVEAGSVVKKMWAIKNSGPSGWPVGIVLTYVDGPIMPDKKESPITVPSVQAGETYNLSIEVRAPTTLGRAFGNYRLATAQGVRFGPKIWIDVNIVAKPVAKPASPVKAAPSSPKKEDKKPEPKKVDSPTKAKPQETKKSEAKPESKPAVSSDAMKNYKYKTEMGQLKDMGYNDDELLMYLLGRNKGDVQTCVDWLLKWNKGK